MRTSHLVKAGKLALASAEATSNPLSGLMMARTIFIGGTLLKF